MGEITDKQNLIAHQSRILINEQEKWKTSITTKVSLQKYSINYNLFLNIRLIL